MPKKKSSSSSGNLANEKYRSYVLTINEKSYTKDITYDNLENYVKENLNTEYFCFDEEKGDTGNLHLHLYLELVNAISFSSLMKKFPGAHIEVRRGSPKEARDYVLKPEGMTFGNNEDEKSHTVIQQMQEFGDFETRLANMKRPDGSLSNTKKKPKSLNSKLDEYIENYNTIEEIEDIDLWFAKQFRDVLIRRFLKKQEQRLFDIIGKTEKGGSGKTIETLDRGVYYLYGDSRVGKTYGVKLKYGSKNVYTTTTSKNQFDNYNSQEVLHLDEFRSDMAFRDALSLLQGYREDNQANARYQNKIILAKTIIVSTNISIDQQYSEIRMKHYEEWRAFYNRFNRGIWEIIYSEIDDKRYIACISSSKDYSPAARKSLDFSEPPVDINDGMIFVQSNEDFYIVKRLIRLKKSVTEEAIIKQKAKEEEERAESDKAIPWLKV